MAWEIAGPETPEAILEQVIRRPQLHGSHREVLANRARNNDEGDFQPTFLQELQSPHSSKLRHLIVRENDIKIRMQTGEIVLLGVDEMMFKIEAGPLQGSQEEPGIIGVVLGDEKLQRARHLIPRSWAAD